MKSLIGKPICKSIELHPSTIDEEDDIIDEVMERSDEGPAEAIYTSVRYETDSIQVINCSNLI